MTKHTGFSDSEWVTSLSHTLIDLAEAQSRYQTDVLAQRLQPSPSPVPQATRHYSPPPLYQPNLLYYRARFSRNDPILGPYFRRLRIAIEKVLNVLMHHPVFRAACTTDDVGPECWIQLIGQGTHTHLISVVDGLMTHALEADDDGYTDASTQLNRLLTQSQQKRLNTSAEPQNRGYHVMLFYGLHITEIIPVANGMTLVPFHEIEPYIADNALQQIAPDIVAYRAPTVLGAIRKPFLWKPLIRHPSQTHTSSPQSNPSFFENAHAFLRLLAIAHAAPIAPLADMLHCIHQPAARLLGNQQYRGGIGWTPTRPSIDPFDQPQPFHSEALAETNRNFERRNSTDYREYAPIVSRLAQSLARTGEFALEDKILDVAIALERMYELDSSELSFKLRTRAACFLTDNNEQRKRVFRQIRGLYSLRSALVHSRKKSKASRKLLTRENMSKTFDTGFSLARDTLMKLLDEGPPENWDELVISAPDSQVPS